MDHRTSMQRRAEAAWKALHSGVERLAFADLPDHINVGDCAIALGQLAFWERSGIEVSAAFSKDTITPRDLVGGGAIAIQGGGNLGGLYPAHDRHRQMVIDRAPAEVVVIQEPQSVHFVSNADEVAFAAGLGSRPGARIAVRDLESQADLARMGVEAYLAPDAVHLLGAIDAPAPVTEITELLRADKESAMSASSHAAVLDWPARSLRDRVGTRLRVRGFGPLAPARFNPSPAGWARVLDRRFRRGVEVLSIGEVVITDRLHAMLIALQMGRRVVALDNSVKKLTRYHNAWLRDLDAPVRFAETLTEARELARQS